jgi:uncharacterized protein YkwD
MRAKWLPLFVLLLSACAERSGPAAPDIRTVGASPVPIDCGLRALPQDILQRLNAERAAGRVCGKRRMAPAAALRWDVGLHSAAASHSQDMATRNFFDHRSPDGRHVRDRVNTGQFRWKMVGENIAAGARSAPEALQDWLDSPPHCENLMEPAFTDVGVSCARQPGSRAGTYWTMVLARR